MNKVICDICGTSYPEAAEQCPICGYSRDFHVEPLAEGEEFQLDENLDFEEEAETVAEIASEGIRTANSHELDMDVDEDEDDVDDGDDDDDDDEEEDDRRPSALLTVLLVIIIIALLAVSAFIFVKYYLPGMKADDATVPETITVVETVASTSVDVPCTSLVMTSDGEVILEQAGNSWLINVVAMPEDTTDEVVYTSSDESVVTVSQTGTVTAVGEGQAVITITCGEYQLTCDVTCVFAVETTVPDVTEPETEAPTEAPTEVPTEESTEDATEEATEATTEAPTEPVSDIELKLNKTDISFDRIGVYTTLKITTGIDAADVEWTTSNSGVCVVHEGKVTITGPGMAKVTAKYRGQEASCIVRVVLSSSTTTGTTE